MFKRLFVLCLLMTCIASTALAQKPATMDTTITTGKVWIGGNELSQPYHIVLSNYTLTINGWPFYPSLSDLQPKSASQIIVPTNLQCDQQSFVNELTRQRNALSYSKSAEELDQMIMTALMQCPDLIIRVEPWHGSIRVWWKDGSGETLSFGPREPEPPHGAGLLSRYREALTCLTAGYWAIINADGTPYYVAPSDQASVAEEIRTAHVWANSATDRRPARSFKIDFKVLQEFSHPLSKPASTVR